MLIRLARTSNPAKDAQNQDRWFFATEASPGGFGMVHDLNLWNGLFEEYYTDEITDAEPKLERAGIGPQGEFGLISSLIQLEAAVAEQSQLKTVGENIELEIRDLEAGKPVEGIILRSLHTCRAAWHTAEPNRLVVMLVPEEFMTPIAAVQRGYAVWKRDYLKICLPSTALRDEPTGSAFFSRCFSSALAGFLSDFRLDNWVATAAEAVTDDRGGAIIDWLEPNGLSSSLVNCSGDEDGLAEYDNARAQALQVGRYLLSRGGLDRFKRFLIEHAEGTVIDNLGEAFGFTRATETAAERVYGASVAEIFLEASSWQPSSTIA